MSAGTHTTFAIAGAAVIALATMQPLTGGAAEAQPKMKLRALEELVEKKEPGIDLVRTWIAAAKNHVEVLPVARADGERALLALQVTSRSPMGAIALETGGLLIDHGWVRVLGGGCKRLPRSIQAWNDLTPGSTPRLPGAVLVGDDVLGGFFAINGGGLAGERGHVFYYPPQSLRWEDIAPSYSDWLVRMMSGDLDKFYAGVRWPGWRREVEGLDGARGISVYPFLFATGEDISKRSRRPVPLRELWEMLVVDIPTQLSRTK
jgi:hypothetical protein